ncbi:MAG: N-6 DNA methylase [Caldisphaera sp.]
MVDNTMEDNFDNIKKLKTKLINFVLDSPEFRNALHSVAEEINKEAKNAPNEPTIESLFEREMYALLKDVGIKFNPQKEIKVDVIRHVGRGRMDSRIGAVVIEYKYWSKLKTNKDIEKAKKQLEDYIISESKKVTSAIVGFLTDGLSLYEMDCLGGTIISESGKLNVNDTNLLNFVKAIVSLEQSALNAQNLIRDFCGPSYDGAIFEMARTLYNILKSKISTKTEMLKSEWSALFKLSHTDTNQQKRINDRQEALSNIFKVKFGDVEDEYNALFALHTSYAIVLKLLAFRIVSDMFFGTPMVNYKSLITSDGKNMHAFFSKLEDGEVFRDIGVLNLLEGDFFSWYSEYLQGNDELQKALRNVLEILGRYEGVPTIFSKNYAVDLFKELYEATVPQVIRASFGEFYTSFWLAQHVLRSSDLRSDWKVLDPCCGSGTFLIAAIKELRDKTENIEKEKILNQILSRVVGIDLNPLAVLTARINFFINIADLLPKNPKNLVIPIFFGDASYVPEKKVIDNQTFLEYKLNTMKNPINIELPISLVDDIPTFVSLMYDYEILVKTKNNEKATERLISALNVSERTPYAIQKINQLTNQLINLEGRGWNGIWARILTNFLVTARIENFTNIVSNPPWIDWKNLPEGYREKIKGLCIDKGLFSGAGRTGGINLNICALITHVSITNWLAPNGKLAFLMPKELAYQPSYEGWRKSVGGTDRGFLIFYDWSKVGHPFFPVKEDFMTYVIGPKYKKEDTSLSVVPVILYVKKKTVKSTANKWSCEEFANNVDKLELCAGQIIPNSTSYTFAANLQQLQKFKKIAGKCEYIGREGIEFYPQELQIFTYDGEGSQPNTVFVKNIQVEKSKYKIPKQRILLEKKYLYPVVKSTSIKKFKHNYTNLLVPFPYEWGNYRQPIDKATLHTKSPLLLSYYEKYVDIIKAQTKFSDKIRGPNSGEFYGLARTGPYTFRNVHVAFRDSTKWQAVVITSQKMPWDDEIKPFVFQNHAATICEKEDGSFITEDEAHYVCAILNAPIVEEFIFSSTDTRSFPIRIPVFIPKYDPSNPIHKELSELSKKAHLSEIPINEALSRIQEKYLAICDSRDQSI